MAKSQISAGFQKFANKTTKGEYDKARKAERIGRGIPFPIGTKGTGYVSAIICKETKPDNEGVKHPMIRVEVKVEAPEASKGKTLSGPGLMQTIKDGKNPETWSAEMAFTAALTMLENLGLPPEISKEYEEFQECVDWFEEEKRLVHWEVEDTSYTKDGRTVNQKGYQVFALVDESKKESAEGEGEEHDPDASYCTFRGSKHRIVKDHGDTLDLIGVNSGREREGVDKEDVEMIKQKN